METVRPLGQQGGPARSRGRGSSAAASPANASVDTVRGLTADTKSGDSHSVAVCSDGSYGVEKDLISSFPIRSHGGKWEIVQDVPLNNFSCAKIDASVNELKEEKSLVGELLKPASPAGKATRASGNPREGRGERTGRARHGANRYRPRPKARRPTARRCRCRGSNPPTTPGHCPACRGDRTR